jgi:hypothetical protein
MIVQEEVQFYRSFGSPELRRAENAQEQRYGNEIQIFLEVFFQ